LMTYARAMWPAKNTGIGAISDLFKIK
jgi:hypothetical protein